MPSPTPTAELAMVPMLPAPWFAIPRLLRQRIPVMPGSAALRWLLWTFLLALTLLDLGGLLHVTAQPRTSLRPFAILDVTPPTVLLGQPTTVTIRAALRSTHAPQRVILEQIGADNTVLGTVGRLRDNGQGGDAVAGDGVFTGRVSFTVTDIGPILLRAAILNDGQSRPASEPFAIHAIRDPQRLIDRLLSLDLPPPPANQHPLLPVDVPQNLAEQIAQEGITVFGTEPGMLVLSGPDVASVSNALPPAPQSQAATSIRINRARANGRAKKKVVQMVEMLKDLGIKTREMTLALSFTAIHTEGPEAAGMTLNVARGVHGLTIVARFNTATPTVDAQGQEVRIVHEGTIHHIILSKKAMDDLLSQPVIDPKTQKLNFGASTLLHELVHVVAYREGCYDPLNDDDEPFAHGMEDLMNDKIHIALRKQQGHNTEAEEQALLCRMTDLFDKEPKGRHCMQLFGFTVPEALLLQVSAAGLVFTATEGQPATPAARDVTVSATEPGTGGVAQLCFTRRIRRKHDIIADVAPGGKNATPQALTVTVTTQDAAGNPLPPGVYEDFLDILSPSALSKQTVIVRLNITGPGVRLDHTLSPQFPAGRVICLRRVTGGKVGRPETGCQNEHLHALTLPGITIDGKGPFADPNATGCGYGVIVTCP